ncbi:melanoma-associated antigen 10-like isoform X1 [Ochotona princeps]|uniref:melanoma-associated antigen 10-like isoform X1 n=2 Tax=Ochotona princeps TaxID=9978 RepID=UPI002714C13F|nr:melanoma-associated antigen 10-like isoform X1 [Ochotona princeps]
MRTSIIPWERKTSCARSLETPGNLRRRSGPDAVPPYDRAATVQELPGVMGTITPAGQEPHNVSIHDPMRRPVFEFPSPSCYPPSFLMPPPGVPMDQASKKSCKKNNSKFEEGVAQRKMEGFLDAQDLKAKKEVATSVFPSCSASYASCPFLIPRNTKADSAVGGPVTSQGPHRASCSATATVTSSAQLDQGSRIQEEQNLGSPRVWSDAESLIKDIIDDKVADFVRLMLIKYRMKQPVSKAEVLNRIVKNYTNYFPVIFRRAYECMQLVFGIDIKEMGPSGHSYVLVPTMGLTYDGRVGDILNMPKIGLLINILGVIFVDGNCAPEEDIWEVLNAMGVYAGQEHFIYGEPRKLITQHWVQEGYLVYRQVHNSNPPRYEFLWGPRAHAETSKMKILTFLAKVNDTIPSALPTWFEEALKDEEARANVAVRPTGWAEAHAKGMPGTFWRK